MEASQMLTLDTISMERQQICVFLQGHSGAVHFSSKAKLQSISLLKEKKPCYFNCVLNEVMTLR